MRSTLVFLACISFALYVVVGYPFLLGILVRVCAKPVLKRSQLRSVSVLIAVHNGEQFIAEKLESVLSLDYPIGLIEIFVVSDGSTDRTVPIVEQFVSKGVRLI